MLTSMSFHSATIFTIFKDYNPLLMLRNSPFNVILQTKYLINLKAFPLIIKINTRFISFQLNLRWMKTSQKKKRCYFFCYEGVVVGKNVRKIVKSQDFGLHTFFVKVSNVENIATSAN